MKFAHLLSDNFDIKNIVTHPEFMPYALDILSEIKKSNPNIMRTYMGSINKDYIDPSNPQLPKDYDPTQRPWYKDAISKNNEISLVS